MRQITIGIPEEAFSSRRRSPEEFVRELRLAAAIFWYQKGEISQEKAAQIADLNGSISYFQKYFFSAKSSLFSRSLFSRSLFSRSPFPVPRSLKAFKFWVYSCIEMLPI